VLALLVAGLLRTAAAYDLSRDEEQRVRRVQGPLVGVDYHRPRRTHPLYLPMAAILNTLEPFALDLWRHEVATWLPKGISVEKRTAFGGLYQVLLARKA
jgi:hypothetical protein